MILVDTSVWVDHLRGADSVLVGLLGAGTVLTHPFVIGEVSLGHLRQRELILKALQNLPRAVVASDAEVLQFIGRKTLFGYGIGYVDAHLLASVQLTSGTALWSRDKRLLGAAKKLGLAASQA